MYYHKFRAMNTDILLTAESPYPKETFEMAQEFIERCEERFTRFKETSELSALNRSAGDWFTVSPDMLELLLTSEECHLVTKGIFNPAILPVLRHAGYDQSFDQLQKHGSAQRPAGRSHTAKIPFTAIQIDSLRGRVRLPRGMQLDLGGIAKGWITEKDARLIARSSTACAVNAGGDMFMIGQPYGQTAWEIGLEDPTDPVQDLTILLVEEGAVATSSVVKRSWFQGDVKRHHIIDPRSGKPAETPWWSVTAFAPKAVLAETFAKAILIAGPEGSQSLLENNPDISFLAVDAEGQIWKSPTEKENIHEYA